MPADRLQGSHTQNLASGLLQTESLHAREPCEPACARERETVSVREKGNVGEENECERKRKKKGDGEGEGQGEDE